MGHNAWRHTLLLTAIISTPIMCMEKGINELEQGINEGKTVIDLPRLNSEQEREIWKAAAEITSEDIKQCRALCPLLNEYEDKEIARAMGRHKVKYKSIYEEMFQQMHKRTKNMGAVQAEDQPQDQSDFQTRLLEIMLKDSKTREKQLEAMYASQEQNYALAATVAKRNFVLALCGLGGTVIGTGLAIAGFLT